MPELLIRYRPAVVAGEYVQRQVLRAPDIIGRALGESPKNIAVEARAFGEVVIGYADEELGITARPQTVLDAARHLEMQQRGLTVMRMEKRHTDTHSAGLWIAERILREWVIDPDANQYRVPLNLPQYEINVAVYPVDFAVVSNKQLVVGQGIKGV